MLYDFFAKTSKKYNKQFVELISIEEDINESIGEKREHLERKFKEVGRNLLEYPHIAYHRLHSKNKDAADRFRTDWTFPVQPIALPLSISDYFWNDIAHSEIDLKYLSPYSFTFQFKFWLKKPYLSRDEQDFYIIDNPVRKDKVFKLPYVAPSTWKGSLRSALRLDCGLHDKDDSMMRLFGNPRDSDEKFKKGRLHLFPTFFYETGLEVINPHDRERRVGTNPILMECVPIGAQGTFTLLYVPFDQIGKDESETEDQVRKDLDIIAQGLKAMFTEYGFGAKTSSGYGVAADQVESGQISLNIPGFIFPQDETLKVEQPEEAFLKYLDENGVVDSNFEGGGKGGLLSNKEYNEKGSQYGGGSLSEFKKFRRWYDKHGEQWQAHLKAESTETEYPVCSFDSLSDSVRKCAAIKTEGEEKAS